MTVTYRIFQVLLCAAIVTIGLLFSSCAEDSSDTLLETEIEEELVTEEILQPPRPDWDDGVMTITIGGRFETKQQMINALGPYIDDLMKRDILDEEFTPTPLEKRYTVDITVRTMLEAGFTKPATLREVKDQYWDQGYGPLTFEEVLELRLQLKDQPHSGTGHRMSNFQTIPTSGYTWPRTYSIKNLKIDEEEDKYVHGGRSLDDERPFDPNEVYLQTYPRWIDLAVSPQELPFRFAATVRGSVVRK